MSFERLKSYTVEADEKKVSFKLAPKTFGQKVTEIITCFIFLGAPLFLAIINLVATNPSIPHAIIGAVCFILAVIGLVLDFLYGKKYRRRFCFTIDESGVSLTDVSGEFRISWLDVGAFGVVTYVPYGSHRHPSYMSQIYFSTAVQEERYIRKKGSSIKSDNSTIVFPLYSDDVGTECLSICEYIYRYCNKEKQKNFYEFVAYLVYDHIEKPWYIEEYKNKNYLHSRRLQLKDFANSDDQHRHCDLCKSRFSNTPNQGSGYYENSSKIWICETCYNDFKELFKWSTD